MNDLIKKFLSGIGIDAKVIATLSKQLAEGEQAPEIDPLIAEFKATQRNVVKNDHDFITEIKNEILGRERGIVENAVKQIFELTPEQITEAEKAYPGMTKYKSILTFGKENAAKSKDVTLQDLQKELQQKNVKLLEYENEIIPKIKDEAKSEVKKDKLKLYISNKQFEDKRLLMKRPAFNTNLEMQINKKYIADVDENGNSILRTLKGLIPQNENGTKNLTIDEILEKEAIDLGVFAESNAGESTQHKGELLKEIDPKEVKYNLPGLEAAQKHLKEISKKV